MSGQRDVSKNIQEQENATEKDIDKLAPLNVSKPKQINEGIQSNAKESFLKESHDLYSSIRDYISSYISLADAKASVLIGVLTGILSFNFFNKAGMLQVSLKTWRLIEYLTFCSWIFFIIGIGCALYVVWPKTLTSKRRGLVSWVHIANYDKVDSYLKDILSSSNAQLSEQVCELNYDLSMICKRKYYWLSWAFKLGILGIALMAFVLVKSYF